ncbi:MAG: PQQ-binding-like beta-propeller repeat protein [Ktedonobacterales bacterium]|jgi:outer membrane protein assembly factor BamB
MGSLALLCGGYQITLEDSLVLRSRETAEAQAIPLDDGQRLPASNVRVVAERDGAQAWQITLTSSGGGTVIHEHSAVCIEPERLALAIGPYVVALVAATGEIAWKWQCDPATCFGVYLAPNGVGVITHGEQQIACVSPEGEQRWRYTGKDIFTGPFEVVPEGVLATDFTGDVYALGLDGTLRAVARGKPFPH